MRNYNLSNNPFNLENESTKMIVAVIAGIAAGAILTSLFVSKNKYNFLGTSKKATSKRNPQSILSKDNANIPHPEEYGGGMMDVIIQAT
ncbi:hypothetical protein [Desertivirga brevis]|uniref:hypothetical protein n=1 Tax=Desertivirga brevis TaxID=2810310 RepID=UPI001A976539|nr:hypothetical protein [Pedobacter sp. SYSU D00873]